MPYTNEPIAVVGSGCRFPGNSSNPSRLWDLLQDPRDVQRKIDRFNPDSFYHEDGHYHGASNVRAAYLLAEDPKLFDAQFFNIPINEAEVLDPQQRLLMETVYEALETAGISTASLSGSRTAVYVGAMTDDFSHIVYYDTDDVPTYASTGTARSIISNRISYFFNWHGPSMTIDTACSSSLFAVHSAMQDLRSGAAPVALATGTNLIFGPTMFVAESNLNMLSKDGRSRMWDAGANGYARGEGVAAIVMKTLSAALRDGDHIEYIIRETGVNQDGKTPGITMPSSDAQAALIRDTYARAGLDITKRSDRCQYFEAHGTGTPAGDPQEAGAIFKAFFANRDASNADPSDNEGVEDEDILYVGSIKTVIGHTEGTAGIAGLMKGALAIQNNMIPPNMLFTKLNPDLRPYYDNLKVPVQLHEWPSLPPGVPRRVSVNSFGFGGANAHAIIESYEPDISAPPNAIGSASSSTPYLFVFSASSEKSLVAQLKSYLKFFEEKPDFSLSTLSWSLFRRTAFPFRVTFSATSAKWLVAQIESAIEDAATKKIPLGTRANPKSSREIMGVFTGQGAQWATMGRELIIASSFAESIIDDLEKSLADLPDAPEWSLKAEILALKEKSRVAEGVISQPLCTAIQIMVVKVLRQAGVGFNAVVGHSSGEIACAYVSGFLSARDAIRVAFYRGKYTPLAKGGAMIACGTDMQDAIDLCSLPKLKGRGSLAASNSSSSVTISGDADAIDLVEIVMQDESRFARKLKVDTAYHSSHMAICSEPYLMSLQKCDIQVHEPAPDACPWYSSVREDNERVTMSMASTLKNTYWLDNMLRPVLFSQALTMAVTATEVPGAVLEVGPSPALKGPASTTIEEVAGSSIPYFGTLVRGQNDALAMANTLGSIWTVLGASVIDLQSFQRVFVSEATFSVSKALPSYSWDHDRILWNEGRVSKTFRRRSAPKHELLGVPVDAVESELRWRNFLKPTEMPWLKGHQIQSQLVFPAAGFAVMALEAGRKLAPFENISLMELQHFSIHKALSFGDEKAGVEIIFVLSDIRQEDGYTMADFGCHACLNKDIGDFTSMASGLLKLTLGAPSHDTLPERPEWPNNFINTDVEVFYKCMAELGYGYTGMFHGMTDIQRTNAGSKGSFTITQDEDSRQQDWIIHPATLDVAFTAEFAAVGAPGDGRLHTLHIPLMIDSITINPHVTAEHSGVEVPLRFDAWLGDPIDNGWIGDVDVYGEHGRNAIVQIQGLLVRPLTKTGPADDRETFANVEWRANWPALTANPTERALSDDEEKISIFAERLSFYILRHLCENVPAEQIARDDAEHQRAVLKWAQDVVHTTRAGKHAICPKVWLADTWETLEAPAKRLASIDAQIRRCLWVKERLEPFVHGKLNIEEELESSRLMDEIFANAPCYQMYTEKLTDLVKQISFKYRNPKVLEIGTGEGLCAQAVLGALADNFTSYTCTDTTSTHFDDVRGLFTDAQMDKMTFKTLDLGTTPTDQGFVAGHYDMIVASNALHDTPELEEMLKHIRSLLRPGGYLAFLEPTKGESLTLALGGCLRPGWFAGIEQGRQHSPLAAQKTWDSALRATEFTGIDTATPEDNTFAIPFSVMCSRATTREMDLVQDPLAHAKLESVKASLLIVGGRTLQTSHLARGLSKTLTPYFDDVIQAETLMDVDDEILATKPTTICFTELDEPVFKPFTEEKYKAMVKVCDKLHTMLWITVGSRGENPYMNMMVAVGRCLEGEMPHLRLQFLNFDGNDRPTPTVLAHHLLQLHLTRNFSGEVSKAGEPLFTLERELTIQNGTLLIPRYLHVEAVNSRLNSDRRLITRSVDPSSTTVELGTSSSCYKLFECSQPSDDDHSIKVQVSKASLNAVKYGNAGYLYIVLGQVQSGKKVVALSESNQSIVSVPKSYVVEVDVVDIHETDVLLHVIDELLALAVITCASGSVLVHGPHPALATSLSKLAVERGKPLAMTSTSTAIINAKLIHKSSPDRVLAGTIPRNLSSWVDLSDTAESSTIGSRFKKLLPANCDSKNISHFCKPKSLKVGTIDTAILTEASRRAMHSAVQMCERAFVIPASAMLSHEFQPPGLQIVDWKADTSLPVAVIPADELMHFRGDRTYFLVGLTGELGLQMTKWMVSRGARHLALSSRNPKFDPQWLEFVQSQGASVKMYPMDVTSRASVQKVHKHISTEMPPIAGVMNGAMILIDALLINNTHAEFEKTLRPKVDGTVFLDEIFSTNDLDFFIVFSSLAAVGGNLGQSAYAVANQFMCGLIANRRMRGLAGSAINMPGIIGLGYLNRSFETIERLKKASYNNMSEWDFYQFLSEAIVAGRPDSGMNPEITAGLQRTDPKLVENPPLWAYNPKFHPLRMITGAGAAVDDRGKDEGSVRSKLAKVVGKNDAYDVVLDGLIANLCSRLKMEHSSITPETSIVELGVDSLLAVDLRSWFSKELGVDMPVLRLLGGATITELVEDVVSRLSADFVPNMAQEGEEPAAEASQNPEQQPDADKKEEISSDAVNDATALPDQIEQPAEESQEEQLTIAPIDIPFFGELENGSLAPSIAQPSITRTESNVPSSAASTSPTDSTEDVEHTTETSATSESDMELDDYDVLSKQAALQTTMIEREESVAKLHSHLPNRAEKLPEFIKKTEMSYGCSRFWFLMQYLQDPTTFNTVCRLEMSGHTRVDDADRCVIELGNRHEVFRTAFFDDPERMNEPTMGLLKETPLRLERRRASSIAEVEAEFDELINYEFKLEQGETIRLKLISLDDETHFGIFAFHHIAMDGFSFNILLSELNMLYEAQMMDPVPIHFSDFATRQRRQVADGSLEVDFQFWKDMYSIKLPSGETKPDFLEPLPLFSLAQSARKRLDDYEYEECKLLLDSRTVRQIRSRCRREKITTFHFFLGAFRTFLFRHLDIEDLVIGIADANRNDPALDGTMGFLLNLLPLRFKNEVGDAQLPFKDIAVDARNKAREALAHSSLPFDALLEKLDMPRSTTHSPLFQAWMDYRPVNPNQKPAMFGTKASGTPTVGRTGYDITLDVQEADGNQTWVAFRMQKYLYSAEATRTLLDSYMRLVKGFASNFDVNVDSVSLWDETDIDAAKKIGRGPQMQLEWPATISHRIAEVARENPHKEALKDRNGSYTYQDMQHRIQAISDSLCDAGVRQGSRLAVFQQPSADWICSLLAIWHVGATYIPMDLRNSVSRLAAIAETAKPSAILCDAETEKDVPELKSTATIINVTGLPHTEYLTQTKAKANTPALILFTSGSTGTPKGIILHHSALRNTIEGPTKQFNIGAERVLQQSAFTFDFSIDQILCGLANGGSVYVVSKEDRLDPMAISRIIAEEGITYTRATPAEYTSWTTYGADDLMKALKWKFAWGGGERMPPSLRRSIESLELEGLTLYNSYGPAESITCTKMALQPISDLEDDEEAEEDIPVGYPLPNYLVYIVDRNLSLVPQGVTGEIVIGGPSLANGYLNNQKLSGTQFVSNPWDKGVIYRTGDIGFFRKDGALMYRGRIAGDTQVKIRGMRIDLQDIEACILTAAEGALHKVVVSVRGGDLLVAHVQFAPDEYAEADEAQQRALLRSLRFMLPLPAYMVPAVFVPIGQMPVNVHGKTDRAAVRSLPLPQAECGRTGEALTETEKRLVEAMKEIVPDETVDVVQVSSNTSFFELGGNSLLLVKLQLLLRTRFDRKFTLIDLFSAATLGAMAAKIDSSPSASTDDVERGRESQSLGDDRMGVSD